MLGVFCARFPPREANIHKDSEPPTVLIIKGVRESTLSVECGKIVESFVKTGAAERRLGSRKPPVGRMFRLIPVMDQTHLASRQLVDEIF